MIVRGRTSGKWQTCDIVTVDGNLRFQVTGACGERKFELTFEQFNQACDAIDPKSMTPREKGLMRYFWADVDTLQVH